MEAAIRNIYLFLEGVEKMEKQRSGNLHSADEIALKICEKLRLHLQKIIGTAGYHALISRALAVLLKDTKNLWFKQLRIRENGELFFLDSTRKSSHPDDCKNAIKLPAQLLVTLATLIGETLTLNLAGDIWTPEQAQKEGVKATAL